VQRQDILRAHDSELIASSRAGVHAASMTRHVSLLPPCPILAVSSPSFFYLCFSFPNSRHLH
jgi:hypothetical protein